MSEEEIIKTLQDLIEAKFSIKEIRTMNLLNENDEMPYVLTIFERHTIQDLLDLYKELKEKNASLQKEIEEYKKDKKDNMSIIYGGRRFGIEGMVVKDYISKDKIREFISKYSKFTVTDKNVYSIIEEKDIRKELLEE